MNLNIDNGIIPSLSALTSLISLNISWTSMEGYFPVNEFAALENLKTLDITGCRFNGYERVPILRKLEILNLADNNFKENIIPSLSVLSSHKVLDLSRNQLDGTFVARGLCELKNLHELDLSSNMLKGSVPECLSSLSSLKLLDISSNHFSGMLPPSLIANLTSLEYIDISHNKFEGSFSFSSFSDLAKLEVVLFINVSHKFELETEEPIGWIPMFQLKVLVQSYCNMKRAQRSVVPRFLHHQNKLQMLDLSHNSIEGLFPNWLIENNTKLEAVSLRNNSFGGTISVPLNKNSNMMWLDISENLMSGSIPSDIHKFFPYMFYLSLSSNALGGGIPSSLGELSELVLLDISDNDLSGEVPKGLFTNLSPWVIKLSNNKLHGQVLSGNLSLGMGMLFLDSNCFTGKIGNLNMRI